MPIRCHDTARTGAVPYPFSKGMALAPVGDTMRNPNPKSHHPTPNFTMAFSRPVGPPTRPTSTTAAPHTTDHQKVPVHGPEIEDAATACYCPYANWKAALRRQARKSST